MAGVEFLAVIAIASNIVALVDFSVKVYDRAKGFSDDVREVPEEFRAARSLLPLLGSAIKKTLSRANAGKINEETCKVLRPVLENCRNRIEELRKIFEDVLPAKGASKWTRVQKAISSVGKDKKVKSIIGKIQADIQVLTYHHASEAPTAAELEAYSEKVSVSSTSTVTLRSVCFMVRYQQVGHFIGRDGTMKEIENQFVVSNRVALVGIGGVGKSRIAIEFCYRHRNQHPDHHIFWVHGGSKARFEGAYEEIATAIGIPKLNETKGNYYNLVSDWLSDAKNGSWLMVVDNADDSSLWAGVAYDNPSSSRAIQESIPLIQYLPRGSHGHILLTTRDAQLGKLISGNTAKPITISPFDSTNAELLLRSRISEDDEIDQNDIAQLVKALDYLPLAITQAAAYLDQTSITVRRYLQLLRDGKTDRFALLNFTVYDINRDHEIQSSIFQTWKLSFEQISKHFLRAADLLSLIAMFDRHAIQTELLQPGADSNLEFMAALQKLKAFSLIDEETVNISVLKVTSSGSTNQFSWVSEESSIISMHRLVQLSVRKWLEHQRTLQTWREAALLAVVKLCPSVDPAYWSIDNWRSWKLVSPHVHVFIDCEFQSDVMKLHRVSIMHVMAEYLWNSIEYRECGRLVRGRISREAILGPDISRLFSTTPDIICNNPERFEDTSIMFQRVLDDYVTLVGKQHPKYLSALRGLGSL